MKTMNLLLCIGILAVCAPILQAQAKPNKKKPPQQQAPAQETPKERWVKAFEDARTEFRNNYDQATANFATEILGSLNKPEGDSPEALKVNFERVQKKVRELVQHGVLRSACILNLAQIRAVHYPGFDATEVLQPQNPICKTGGKSGPDGLILYMPFDEPDKNGFVSDLSLAGNDGQIYGAKWIQNGGRFGGAYRFSITNLTDRIVIPNSDTLNPDYITLSAWIKTGVAGFWSRIIDKHFIQGYSFHVAGGINNNGRFGLPAFESSEAALCADVRVDDDQWHHVAVTYDGMDVCYYVDGKAKTRHIKTNRPLKKSQWDLCIGNSVVDYRGGDFLAFDGMIDEVRIYNRALSPEEVQALATATSAKVNIGASPVSRETPAVKTDPAERLKKLKALFEQGLLPKEEYDKKVKEIMDSL